MNRLFHLIVALAACFVLIGCDRPEATVGKLRTEIAEYKTNPTDVAQATIEADFARLDEQIAKLEARGKSSEASTYRSTADNLQADYRAARMMRSLKDAQSAIQGVGEAVKEAGKSIGDVFKSDDPEPQP